MTNNKKSCGHLRCGSTCRFGKKKKKVYVIKRTPIKKKVYRIPKKSEKRKLDDEIYFALREQFLKEHPKCECGRPGCHRKSCDVHHTEGRVGANYLDVGKWKALSRSCHQWAEINPQEAKKIGLSENRLD